MQAAMKISALCLLVRCSAVCFGHLAHASAQGNLADEIVAACRIIGARGDEWKATWDAMQRLPESVGLNREVARLLRRGTPEVMLGAAALLSESDALPSECLVARRLLTDAERFDLGSWHVWAWRSPDNEIREALALGQLGTKQIADLLWARDERFLQIEMVRELLRREFVAGHLPIIEDAKDLFCEDLRQFIAIKSGVLDGVLCEEWRAFSRGKADAQVVGGFVDLQSIEEFYRAWYVAGVVEAVGVSGFATRYIAGCTDAEGLGIAMTTYALAMKLALQFPIEWSDGHVAIAQPGPSALPEVHVALALIAPCAYSPHASEWDERVWTALMTVEWAPFVMEYSRRMGAHTRSFWGQMETRYPRILDQGLRVLSNCDDESVALAARSARCILGTATVAECLDLMVAEVVLPKVFPAHTQQPLMDALADLGDHRGLRRIQQLSEGLKQRGYAEMSSEFERRALYAIGLPDTYIKDHADQGFGLDAIKDEALDFLWDCIEGRAEPVNPLLVKAAGLGCARARSEIGILHASLTYIAGSAWQYATMTECAGRVWLEELPNVLRWADCPDIAFSAMERYAIAMGMWSGPLCWKRKESLGPRRAWPVRVANELLGKPVVWSRLERCWVVQ